MGKREPVEEGSEKGARPKEAERKRSSASPGENCGSVFCDFLLLNLTFDL